jgi:hypothetical protein
LVNITVQQPYSSISKAATPTSTYKPVPIYSPVKHLEHKKEILSHKRAMVFVLCTIMDDDPTRAQPKRNTSLGQQSLQVAVKELYKAQIVNGTGCPMVSLRQSCWALKKIDSFKRSSSQSSEAVLAYSLSLSLSDKASPSDCHCQHRTLVKYFQSEWSKGCGSWRG